jgi:adenine-specific DNA-methyltransferase
MNKPELIKKINSTDFLNKEEKTALIELLNHNKRYGLVWENKTEDAEELLRENLPVLKEVVEKRISGKKSEGPDKKTTPDLFNRSNTVDPQNSHLGNYPNHILIEGDNLHALTALSFTHEGKIDVIYIDPPYNTGNKDFRYNDSFVDKDDSYRHSKWLSFMSVRMKIAKKLLKETGLIFISIDDNEQAQLKLLCDEIFGINNFKNEIVIKRGAKNVQAQFETVDNLTSAYEKVLFYSNNAKYRFKRPEKKLTDAKTGDWNNHWRGTDRPTMRYSLFGIKPATGQWRWGESKSKQAIKNYEKLLEDLANRDNVNQEDIDTWWLNKFEETGEEIDLLRLSKNGKPEHFIPPTGTTLLNDVWFDIPANSSALLKTIFGKKVFDNPKPIEMIYRVLNFSDGNCKILDFFAGSGTTLHATMQLNAEDGGNRQCILVTNNENNICEEVTYVRNKRVIEGYTNAKGEKIQGLTENNLRYFKTEFVSRERSLKNKRKLTELSIDLLRIKENCYNEIKGAKNIRLFNEGQLFVMIVGDDIAIPKAVTLVQQLPENSHIKVYVFSEERDPYTEDFYEVLDRIELCALPDAIYKAYRHVLPKKKIAEQEAETTSTGTLH